MTLDVSISVRHLPDAEHRHGFHREIASRQASKLSCCTASKKASQPDSRIAERPASQPDSLPTVLHAIQTA
jgi:hypothetical protein